MHTNTQERDLDGRPSSNNNDNAAAVHPLLIANCSFSLLLAYIPILF